MHRFDDALRPLKRFGLLGIVEWVGGGGGGGGDAVIGNEGPCPSACPHSFEVWPLHRLGHCPLSTIGISSV